MGGDSSSCNTLQHTATHCNTLQHTVRIRTRMRMGVTSSSCSILQHTATHCFTLRHTATHCITLQHRRNNLILSAGGTWGGLCVAIDLNLLQQSVATDCFLLQQSVGQVDRDSPVDALQLPPLQHACCDTLQHTLTHRNTLQHTATHCNATWPVIARRLPPPQHAVQRAWHL